MSLETNTLVYKNQLPVSLIPESFLWFETAFIKTCCPNSLLEGRNRRCMSSKAWLFLITKLKYFLLEIHYRKSQLEQLNIAVIKDFPTVVVVFISV